MAMEGVKYRVFFTPKVSISAYGDEIDVSDYILQTGLNNIRRSIDSSDYSVGVYSYDDLSLKGYNKNGYFNDQNDSRSIFPSGRDQCKVRVEFVQYDDEDNETDTIVFNGLINEEATRVDVVAETIDFKVLSLDSVIRNTKVAAGLITNGTTIASAIESILSNTRIAAVLSVDTLDINPAYNPTIDVGSVFDNMVAKEALDQLLLVSNSVMIIDSGANVIVRSRDESTDRPILNLYGKSDILGRENIITITDYNTGFHRVFNSVMVNDVEESNAGLQLDYGVRQRQISVEFITDPEKEATIAETILEEFKSSKAELKVKVPIRTILGYDLLDRVSINYPLRAKPPEGTFLPVYDVAKYGDTLTPYPLVYGSVVIQPRLAFKIIQIDEDPRSFTATLKLRQVGSDVFDGVFDVPGNSLYDFAIYGESVYIENTDSSTLWNPSVYGAGQYGETRYE